MYSTQGFVWQCSSTTYREGAVAQDVWAGLNRSDPYLLLIDMYLNSLSNPYLLLNDMHLMNSPSLALHNSGL